MAVQPLLMKKGRSGQLVTTLVRDGNADQIRSLWPVLAAASACGSGARTLGVAEAAGRARNPLGPVAAKQVRRPDGRCTVKAEADVEALQTSTGCPLMS